VIVRHAAIPTRERWEMIKMRTERHKRDEDDDRITFYTSRHGTDDLPLTRREIAEMIGTSEDSLIMRQRNFAFLDGRCRLKNAAQLSHRVHEECKNASQSELLTLAKRALDAKRQRLRASAT
jgi:hypothetical protein